MPTVTLAPGELSHTLGPIDLDWGALAARAMARMNSPPHNLAVVHVTAGPHEAALVGVSVIKFEVLPDNLDVARIKAALR